MNCDPSELIEAAKCFRCIPNGQQGSVQIFLLCQWANNQGPCIPPVIDWLPPLFAIAGGFHGDFVVTTAPTLDIIVYWGFTSGGPYPNTVTLAPNATGFDVLTVIPPGENVFAIFVARNSPTCFTNSSFENSDIPPILPAFVQWDPATEIGTWTDGTGPHATDYTTFLATADLTTLSSLDLNNTAITSLVANYCPSLTTLSCAYCSGPFTSIDVTGCTVLSNLYCFYGDLATLDVSTCLGLFDLNCSANLLTSLDVSTCILLSQLRCFNNLLTTLNVAGCLSLTNLNCIYNSLTTGVGGSVNIILTDMVTNNPPVGIIDVSIQAPAAPPDAGPPDGATAKTTLLGLGWIVTTD